jgi:hypothetical protein
MANTVPTERPVHGGTFSIPSHDGPRPPTWKPHASRGGSPRHLPPPLFTAYPLASPAQTFARNLHPLRSTSSRRRLTLATMLSDGGEAAQGEGMCAEVGFGEGPGGGGESRAIGVRCAWHWRLGKVWSAVTERPAPASSPASAVSKFRVGSIVISTPGVGGPPSCVRASRKGACDEAWSEEVRQAVQADGDVELFGGRILCGRIRPRRSELPSDKVLTCQCLWIVDLGFCKK